MILNISNICKSYDGNDILKGVSFHIEEHEKAALVGVNGAGKSTLLKIIMGLEDADSGNTVLSKDSQIGYLEVTGVLRGLGFAEEEFGKRIGELSGGQKTRVALGRLLLTAPDIILLDEPTNHLDMHSIEWLETYLMNYSGAVLIVSHDRYFLNRVVTKVIEIERGTGRVYSGNYDAFSQKKEALRAAQYAAWLNAERERQHQEAVITKLKQFNREKSIKRAESREKLLEKMEMPDKPVMENQQISFHFKPATESGRDVLLVDGLEKGFNGVTLFEDIHFEIHKGEHVALIGDNGTGKSTILKILNDVILPDKGSVHFGTNVLTGYYDQEMQVLDSEKTIFEEISDDYPTMTNTEIRSHLAAFLFTEDDVFKRIGDLSGGERARVSLCKLMLSNAHLDINSREVLESAVRAYEGTVFYVSHDRYFINRTASRILDLTQHQLLNYIGNYDYYIEKKADVERAYLASEAAAEKEKTDTAAKLDWKSQKEKEARKRKQQNDLLRLESRIEALEQEDRDIDVLFEDPETASDPQKLTELSRRKEAVASELEEAYSEWESLQEESGTAVE